MIAIGLVWPASGSADVYLRETDSGVVELTDDPGKLKNKYELIVESNYSEKVEVPSGGRLKKLVSAAAAKYQLPEALVLAVIKNESNGDTKAVSRSGARGLMQLMPSTASELGVEDIYDPRQNIFAGSKYLKRMLNRHDGDLSLALAAYNAGPGAVDEHDGIPPYDETEFFVKKTRKAFRQFKSEADVIYTYTDEDGVVNVTNIE